MEQKLNIFSKKQYVNNVLLLIENTGNGKYLEKLTQFGQFSFTYNSIFNTNPNPGHAINEFIPSRNVAMQFQVHSLNFQTVKNQETKFKYFFWLISIYLVQPTKKPEISTPSRRKNSPDK